MRFDLICNHCINYTPYLSLNFSNDYLERHWRYEKIFQTRILEYKGSYNIALFDREITLGTFITIAYKFLNKILYYLLHILIINIETWINLTNVTITWGTQRWGCTVGCELNLKHIISVIIPHEKLWSLMNEVETFDLECYVLLTIWVFSKITTSFWKQPQFPCV